MDRRKRRFSYILFAKKSPEAPDLCTWMTGAYTIFDPTIFAATLLTVLFIAPKVRQGWNSANATLSCAAESCNLVSTLPGQHLTYPGS
jgi:hypothetical protein